LSGHFQILNSQFFKNLFPILLILVISFAIAFIGRQKPGGDYPKVDAIAFYNAGKMIREGKVSELYKIIPQINTVEMQAPPTGGLPGSPMEFRLVEVWPGTEYSISASEAGYANKLPPVFLYLPAFAYLCVPFTFVSFQTFTLLFDFVMVSCLLVSIFQFLKKKIHCPKRLTIFSLIILLLLFFSHPFLFSLYCGQISPLFAAIIFWLMIAAEKQKGGFMTGILLGLIMAMKFFPLLLLIPLIIQKGNLRKIAIIAAITATLLIGASFVLVSGDTLSETLQAMQAMTMGTKLWSGNQSISAFIDRFYFSTNMTQMPAVSVLRITNNPIAVLIFSSTILILFMVYLLPILCHFFIRDQLRDEQAETAQKNVVFAIAIAGALFCTAPLVWSHYLLFLIPLNIMMLFVIIERYPGKIQDPKKLKFIVMMIVWGLSTLAIHHNPDVWVDVNNQYLSGFGEVSSSLFYRVLISLPTIGYLTQIGICLYVLNKGTMRMIDDLKREKGMSFKELLYDSRMSKKNETALNQA